MVTVMVMVEVMVFVVIDGSYGGRNNGVVVSPRTLKAIDEKNTLQDVQKYLWC